MKDLKQYREELDSIDLEIIKLFEKRMSIIKYVAIYKKENNLPILNETREEMMLQKNLKNLNNAELKEYYKAILKTYLDVSKKYQIEIITNNK